VILAVNNVPVNLAWEVGVVIVVKLTTGVCPRSLTETADVCVRWFYV